MFKLNNARLRQNVDASIAEIVKGNKIIKRIQNKRKAQGVQIRMKNLVIKEQEKRIKSLETYKTESQRKVPVFWFSSAQKLIKFGMIHAFYPNCMNAM